MTDKQFYILLGVAGVAVLYASGIIARRAEAANEYIDSQLPKVPDDWSDFEQVKEFLYGGFPESVDDFLKW